MEEDVDHEQREHRRRETDLTMPPAQDNDQTNNICIYSNIRLKLDQCFKSSTDCK